MLTTLASAIRKGILTDRCADNSVAACNLVCGSGLDRRRISKCGVGGNKQTGGDDQSFHGVLLGCEPYVVLSSGTSCVWDETGISEVPLRIRMYMM